MYRNVQNILDEIPSFESIKIDNQRRGNGVGKITLFAKSRVRVGQKKLTKWEKVWRWTKSVGVLLMVALVLFLAVIFSEDLESPSIENLEKKSYKIRRNIDSRNFHRSHIHEDILKAGKSYGSARKSINAILLTYPWIGLGYVGDLFTLTPESAYLLEPSPLWTPETKNNVFSLKPQELLNGLFNCHRGILRKMATTRPFKMIRKLTPIKPNQTDNTVRLWRETDATLAVRCSKSKLRLVETARLQIEDLISLVNDEHLKLKIIHLVKDPQHIPKMEKNYENKLEVELQEYCFNVSTNLVFGQSLNRKQYLLIHYEDLHADPMSVVRKVFNFLGLSAWYSTVRDYFRKHRNGRKWKFLEAQSAVTEVPPTNSNLKLNKKCTEVVTFLENIKHSNLYKTD